MSSDGPKNSQGYVRYPALAGMTDEPYFQQLLDYTNGECTRQVANACVQHVAEKFAHASQKLATCSLVTRERIEFQALREFLEDIAHHPTTPPELRAAIKRYIRWRVTRAR